MTVYGIRDKYNISQAFLSDIDNIKHLVNIHTVLVLSLTNSYRNS